MSFDSEAASPAVAAGGNEAPPLDTCWRFVATALKYLLLLIALISPYASAFLTYLLPDLSDGFYEIRWMCWIFVFFLSLSALFQQQWKAIAIFSAAWAWLFLTPYQFEKPSDWLLGEGFRIHASAIGDYLSRCRLVAFTENDVKQTVGLCDGVDKGTVFYNVYYDTTGEFALSPFQRTLEWRLAMSQLESEELLRYSARPMSGNFYRMGIPLEMFRGDDGRVGSGRQDFPPR
jgi:hypothetical protein